MNPILCVNPGAIQDWELDALLDGQDMPHVQQHLRICAACRTRLEQNAVEENLVRQALFRLDCPSTDSLREYYWKALPTSEQTRIQNHLHQCSYCQTEFEQLKDFVEPRPVPLSTVELTLQDMARAMKWAILSLVAPNGPAMMPLRGQMVQSLLFEDEQAALSLNLTWDDAGQCTLFGQVLSPAVAAIGGLPVQLSTLAPEKWISQTELSSNATFELSRLNPGVYQLSITFPDLVLLIPDLVLENSGAV